MDFTPFHHQELGINHLINHDEGGLFAGMGLGKTAMTLAALSHHMLDGGCKGALIIAPLRVSVFTWADEVAQWDQFKWMKIVSLRTQEGIEAWHKGDAAIYTINYEALFKPKYGEIAKNKSHPKGRFFVVHNDEDGKFLINNMGETEKVSPVTHKIQRGVVADNGILRQLFHGKRGSNLPIDTVVWDELSKCKDPKGKRAKLFRRYRDKIKRHWGLTGTPSPNGYMDLFGQMLTLDDGKTFGKFITHYRDRYFEPENPFVPTLHQKYVVREGCKGLIEKELKKIILTLRSEDYLDIPPTETIDVDVKLPPKAMTIYKRLQKELIVRLDDSKVRAVNQAVLVGKLQQVLGGAVYAQDIDSIFATDDTKVVTELHDAKIKALRKLWEAEGKQPMLVATKFIHERKRILKAIPEAVEFSSDKLDDWNAGKIPLLVAHPASMSHGLNMQHGGSRACWFTPTHSREEYDQFNARVVRTGQEAETKIFRLIVPQTVDDAVIATLEYKGELQSGLLKTLTNIQELGKVI